MKCLTVIGARPQFIKAAPVSRALAECGIHEELLHTGQHFDAAMSDVFFDELKIPNPKYRLGLGGGTHGAMTGAMLSGIEEVILAQKPDLVLVYGDTNSTLAGALAAAKLHIPIAHVEAGLRSFNKKMPEEINRICTDHVSTILFCPSEVSAQHLKNEGIVDNVHIVGDVMEDAFFFALQQVRSLPSRYLHLWSEIQDFALMTIHRAENTNDPESLKKIFLGLEKTTSPIIFPVHPRTLGVMKKHGVSLPKYIHAIEPVGYLEMVALLDKCTRVITDSGGLQKEAYWASKPCLTLREETEWVETVNAGWNILAGPHTEKIAHALLSQVTPLERPILYGGAGASNRIAKVISTL